MIPKQSDSFKLNRFFWTVFGLWPGRIPDKYYKYFSFIYLHLFFVIYIALLTLNLFFTPPKIETLIKEITFFFTDIAVGSKIYMVRFRKEKLSAIFEMLDREEFKGSDDIGRNIVQKYNSYSKKYMMTFTIISHFAFVCLVFYPVSEYLLSGKPLDLPICKYYFLSDDTREYYFNFIFVYQAFGMYSHMIYNVYIDTLITGFIILAIGQVKVLCHDLENFKTEKSDRANEVSLDSKLRQIVNHYGAILEYCAAFQELTSVAIFIQFGIGSAVFCVCMCGLLLLSSTVETFLFTASYSMAMNMQILIPSWLGTHLTYESQQIMRAAYKSEWLGRSVPYKQRLRLFVQRALRPVRVTGLKLFPLSLATYISILKTAYSCFAMLRIVQSREGKTTQ